MEQEIYEYLIKNHVGKENLIKNRELRKLFNVSSDKTLRGIIQHIRESKDYRRVIGSVSGKSGGFYICRTIPEIEETINNIKHRANQMLRMCYILEWKKEMED